MRGVFLRVLFLVLLTCVVQAKEVKKQAFGILPGEPDPNPRASDHGVLIDDRETCPPGTKRFQRMKCALPDAPEPDCMNFAVVLDCRKIAPKLKCKAPEVPVPVYKCIGDKEE